MEEEGLVVEVRPGGSLAKVKIERRAMCESCGKCGLMSRGMTDIVVTARNDAGAEAGERVVVELPSRDVLVSAFIVYMVPLMAAAAGYVLGGLLHTATFQSEVLFSKQSVEVATALGFLLCSFGLIRYYDRKAAKSGRFLPSIVRRAIGPESGGFRGTSEGSGGTFEESYGNGMDPPGYWGYEGYSDREEPPG
ncbi:MAG TPA: SoxR reducing system RseC family protein [Clostridia bacterium]|nr:SoxR reducing system RseC family protein [Clostridia bacterium]